MSKLKEFVNEVERANANPLLKSSNQVLIDRANAVDAADYIKKNLTGNAKGGEASGAARTKDFSQKAKNRRARMKRYRDKKSK